MLKGKRIWEERAGESRDNYVKFLSTPIILEGNVKVYPQVWAQAFLQVNIRSVSRVLSQAIFTPEELSKRNSGEKDALPAIKKVAIARAAKWLMNKYQNPWDFKPTSWFNEKEKAEIDNVFQTFDKVGEMCGIPSGFCQAPIIKNDINNSSAVQCLDLTKRFRNHHSSQEMDTGVFVDAVYFSRECWAKAIYEGTSIQEKAEILFTQFINKETSSNNCLEDLDPIIQLAIIRAVAWMSKLKDLKIVNCYNFDPSLPEHNKFLTWPQIFGIYQYICTKYGTNSPKPSKTMVSPSSSEPINDPPTKSPIISTNEFGDVTINDHLFTSAIWKEAQFRFKLPDGMEKAGKYLFEQVFTTQEIFTCNVSGRGGRPKFSKVKVDTVFFALEYLGRTPLPEGIRNFQKTKIFVEHPNYLRLKSAKVNLDVNGNST